MLRFLRREPGFYRRTWQLALPIMLQNLITTSLGFVDTFMVGLLGQDELSAVTAANSPIFLVQLVVFGILSGLSVLASQYWGKRDTESINRCMGVALYAGLALTGAVALTLFLAPRTVMGLITNNPRLIELGASYIRIVGFSYVFNAASSVYVGMQRSVENPLMGTVVFASSMLLNTGLNYVLIFGHFGAPALGVTGAAAATLISRIAEFAITAVYALRCRRVPLRPRALLRPGRAILRSFVKYATPVLVNDALWGLGTTVMTAIMGHMVISSEFLAAHAIMGNIDKFATVFCFGVAAAASVMVGTSIGGGDSRERTGALARRLTAVSFFTGCAVAACLAALLPTVFIPVVYPLFHLEGLAQQIAVTMCVVNALLMPARAPANTIITGILRAGGDVRTATVIDLAPLWFLAVPLTALAGLVLNAPVAAVCLCIQSESICKLPLSLRRLGSGRWINDVTEEGGAS